MNYDRECVNEQKHFCIIKKRYVQKLGQLTAGIFGEQSSFKGEKKITSLFVKKMHFIEK